MSTGDLLLRVECYVAVRKALGYACRSEEKLLNNFVRFLELNGASGPIRAQTVLCASTWTCTVRTDQPVTSGARFPVPSPSLRV
jgi:hypothetical protein